MTDTKIAVTVKQDKAVEYVPLGCQDKIKMTIEIVQNLIAIKTRSGKTCSTRDAINFLAMCQAKRLNPFEGDAYLLGYEGKDGVAKFSLITAHQAYLKRAELHPEFDGMRSGVIVEEDGALKDLDGDFHTEQQTVVGGWATVFFKQRKIPTTRRVRLKRFQKPFGVWQEDPAGMIVKCAEADALRSSFPTMLGGLYMRDEIDISKPAQSEAFDIPASRLVDVVVAPAQPTNGNEQDDSNAELNPAPRARTELTATTNASELSQFVVDNGYTFDDFRKWAEETGTVDKVAGMGSFEEVDEASAKRLLRAKNGMLRGLATVRGGAAPGAEGQML